jgi:hypothetical protein
MKREPNYSRAVLNEIVAINGMKKDLKRKWFYKIKDLGKAKK